MLNQIAKRCIAGLGFATLAVACHSTPSEKSEPAAAQAAHSVREVTVSDVQGFIKSQTAAVFDANDADTRKQYGVLPGAVPLTNNKTYPLSVLPPSKTEKLVFYCGGTQCRASDAAAARAASAGYTDVNVMRAGIRGWKDAGLSTSPAPQS